MKWTTETGEVRCLGVHSVPAWCGGSQCDPSDLIACLKANPEARDTVLRELAPAKCCLESKATQLRIRAEMAERRLAALRDQVAVAGCECSTLGERTYNCRHDNLCGLCRLRHRAENAERERDELHALIHDQSGLDDHKYTPGQMVAEMAARWQGASDDLEKLEDTVCKAGGGANTVADALAWIDRVRRERDEARAELADAERRALCVGVDALPTDATVIKTGNLEALRSRIAKLEAVAETTRELCEAAYLVDFTADPERYSKLGRARIAAGGALRALDAQNSGGSGAAHREVNRTSGQPAETANPGRSEPEPAGSSQNPLAALKAAAARPLTAEDRERIEAARVKLRTGTPRGGLLLEPWERGQRGDYVTRAEMVEACRAAVERYKGGAYIHELAALAAELRADHKP